MHQHLHAPLPLDELEGVPQPLVVLLEALLEKDPGRRFQNPAELLKAIPTITGAIDARRRITRQNLHQIHFLTSRIGTRRPQARLSGRKSPYRDCPLLEAIFSDERRTSLFWTTHGQTRKSTWLPSLPGLGSGSPRWSTIGSDGWLLNSIALHNLFLAGLSTGKGRAKVLHRWMNLPTRL